MKGLGIVSLTDLNISSAYESDLIVDDLEQSPTTSSISSRLKSLLPNIDDIEPRIISPDLPPIDIQDNTITDQIIDTSSDRIDNLNDLIDNSDISPHIPIIDIEDYTMTKEIADASKERFDELEDLITNADITPHIPIINIEDNTMTTEIADESKERFDELEEAISSAEPVTTSPINFDDGTYDYSPNAGSGYLLQAHEDDGPGGMSYDQNGKLVETAPAQASVAAGSLKGLVIAGAAVALLSVLFKGEGAGDKMLKSRKSKTQKRKTGNRKSATKKKPLGSVPAMVMS